MHNPSGVGIKFRPMKQTSDNYSASRIESVSRGSWGTRTDFRFWTANSSEGSPYVFERMRIDYDGDIWIGTENPTSQVHLYRNGSDAFYKFTANTGGVEGSIGMGTDGIMKLQNHLGSGPITMITGESGGTERVRVDSSGNVGIGETNPQKLLDAAKDESIETPTLRITNTKNDYGSSATKEVPHGAIEFYMKEASGNGPAVRAAIKAINEDNYACSHGIGFFTGYRLATPVERLRIDCGGAVGINETNPNSKLHLQGSFAVKRTASASSVSTDDEVIIGVTSTASARTVTLSSADCVVGRIVIVKDESGGAGTNNITMATGGGENIDGAAAGNTKITSNYGVLRLYSDGSNWFTF